MKHRGQRLLPTALGSLVALSVACSALSHVPVLSSQSGGSSVSDQSLVASSVPKEPLLSAVEADNPLVSAGDTVTFHGDPSLNGTLKVSGPSGVAMEAPFQGGQGQFDLPKDAPDGFYVASLSTDDGALAVGEFRVASKPTLWLVSDKTSAGTQSGATLTVYGLNIPSGLTAAVSVGEQVTADQVAAAMQSNKPIDLPSTSPSEFVPDASGHLMPANAGRIPVSKLVGMPLYLPAQATGPVRVIADTPEAESSGTSPSDQAVQSNEITIQACDSGGTIQGDLGAAGAVSVVSLGPPQTQTTSETLDGTFDVSVPAGPALVFGRSGNNLDVQSMLPVGVDVPCGGKVTADLGPSASAPAGRVVDPISPISWPTGRRPSSAAGVVQSAPRPAESGAQASCANIFVMDFKANSPDIPAKIPATFSAWTTSKLWADLSRATVTSMSDIRSLLTLSRMQQLLGGSGGSQVTLADIGGALGADVLVTGTLDKSGSSYSLDLAALDVKAASVITRKSLKASTLEGLLNGVPSFATAMSKAGLCLKVDPSKATIAPHAKQMLTVTVSDLSGRAFGSQVTLDVPQPGCGQLDWTHQTMTGQSVDDTYVAGSQTRCTDKLDFQAQATTDGHTVHAHPATSTVSVNTTWNLTVQTTLGQDPNTFKLKWVGNFVVGDQGKISGVGAGSVDGNLPDYPCIIFDFDNGTVRQEKNPATANGTFSFLIDGSETGSDSSAQFDLKLAGFSTKLTYQFGNKTCSSNASYDIFTGPFIQILAEHPNMVLQSAGGPIQIAAKDGASADVPYTLGQSSTFHVSLSQAGGKGP